MPGGWPIFPNICNAVSYPGTVAFPIGINVPPNATANTKGTTPTQITASTTQECRFIEVFIMARTSGTRQCTAVDIMVGAGGSEQVVMANLVATCRDTISVVRYAMPLSIPAGTRLSARSQMSGTGGTGTQTSVCIRTWDGAYGREEGYAGLDSIGFNAAASCGTSITPSATGGAKGTAVNLNIVGGTVTTKDYHGLIVTFDQLNAAYVQEFYIADIMVGSSIVIIPNIELYQYDASASGQLFYPVQIPAGTQVSARCAAGSASEPAIGVTCYGAY